MEFALVSAGIACLIAGILPVRVEAFGLKFAGIRTRSQRISLVVTGLILIGVAIIIFLPSRDVEIGKNVVSSVQSNIIDIDLPMTNVTNSTISQTSSADNIIQETHGASSPAVADVNGNVDIRINSGGD
jgi:hypothetical protein